MRWAAFALILLACSSSSNETPATDSAVDAAPPKPGDVETYVEVEGSSEGIAFGKDGALYVGISGALHRVNADRTTTKIADVPNLLGFALRADGDFVACGKNDAGEGVIYKVSTSGSKSILVAGPFKQTNFVAVAKDDSIVFSDSSGNKLYRASADGSNVTVITDAITYPNGLSFSPDGQTLYVASWDSKKVYSLARKADGTFDAPQVFLDGIVNVDGVVTAADGDLYLVCSGLGVLKAHMGKTEVIAPGSKFGLSANGAFGSDGWFYVSNLIKKEITRVYVGIKGAPLPVR